MLLWKNLKPKEKKKFFLDILFLVRFVTTKITFFSFWELTFGAQGLIQSKTLKGNYFQISKCYYIYPICYFSICANLKYIDCLYCTMGLWFAKGPSKQARLILQIVRGKPDSFQLSSENSFFRETNLIELYFPYVEPRNLKKKIIIIIIPPPFTFLQV